MLISDTATLSSICTQLSQEVFIAVDTEFLRDRTYYPELCLIQIAGKKDAYAIDVLAPQLDLTPVLTLFDNPQVIKVFHSARQDIEIILKRTGKVPEPFFDTQVAAMVCGFGEAASYETLCHKLIGVRIDKTHRVTDWARRPLSEAQITYALGDVIHLRQIYQKLKEQLEENGRMSWLTEEMAFLTNPKNYVIDPTTTWQKIRLRSSVPAFVDRVKALSLWRELTAQSLNMPRTHVLKDQTLMEIAALNPKTAEGVTHIRTFPKPLAVPAILSEILEALKSAPQFRGQVIRPTPDMQFCGGALVELLRVLLRLQAETHGVAEKLIASPKELALLIHGDASAKEALPCMHGWRYEIFGQLAEKLIAGEIGLSAKNKTAYIVYY